MVVSATDPSIGGGVGANEMDDSFSSAAGDVTNAASAESVQEGGAAAPMRGDISDDSSVAEPAKSGIVSMDGSGVGAPWSAGSLIGADGRYSSSTKAGMSGLV